MTYAHRPLSIADFLWDDYARAASAPRGIPPNPQSPEMATAQRLPPLNSLRVFETAARHLSFTQAALELHVTPSAVSHQIKLLEDDIGVKLFRRENNKILLTEAGACLLEECTSIFLRLTSVMQKVRDRGASQKLNIALRPYFAQKWLIPHIGDFWESHPGIELALHHMIKAPSFSDGSIDIAIIWGDGNFPDLSTRLLVNGDLTPVCSPRLIAPQAVPPSPEILAAHTLLDEETPDNWDRWLKSSGHPDLRPRKRIGIDDTNVRLHAAINGQGVLLTCLSLLEPELREGILVAPFEYQMPHYSYYLAHRPEILDTNPAARVFIDWLVSHTARTLPARGAG